jgi:uncharacterized membrane protein YwzB
MIYVIYALSLVCSTFAISGINFDGFIKKNHVWEARFLAVLMILGLAYLVAQFFIGITNIRIY